MTPLAIWQPVNDLLVFVMPVVLQRKHVAMVGSEQTETLLLSLTK